MKLSKKQKAKDAYLRRKYGIDLAEYNRKLAEQNFSCAICKKHQSHFKRALNTDHNHRTKKVRGLLCYYCNHKLVGRHTTETVNKLLEYMNKYEGK